MKKVVFFGSGNFALNYFIFLLNMKDVKITAVFTREAKKAGRGMKITKTKIHQYIDDNSLNIDVFTPKSLKNFDIVASNLCLPDINFVVSYGLIIPRHIIDFAKIATINIHPSDLPLYRGASPIERTIMNGETHTKSIIMLMDEGLDTGDILSSRDISIELNDNFSSVSKKIFEKSKEQIEEFFLNPQYFLQNKKRQLDDPREPIYANKIVDSDKLLNLDESNNNHLKCFDIYNRIRALESYSGVVLILKSPKIKIKVFYSSIEINEALTDLNKVGHGYIIDKIFKIYFLGGYIIPEKIRNESGKLISNKDLVNLLKSKV